METDKDLPYTIFEKVPGKPQMLKMAPVHPPAEPPTPARTEFPLAGVPDQYPLRK